MGKKGERTLDEWECKVMEITQARIDSGRKRTPTKNVLSAQECKYLDFQNAFSTC